MACIRQSRMKKIHTQTLPSLKSRKSTARRRTGLRRCVYTNPHKHTTTTTGSRASDEDERNTHAPTKPRKASTYIRVCGSSIKQKLKGEKQVTTSEKEQPAGHGPGRSIENFNRKLRRGAASNLDKRNGEAQNSNSVSPSSHHTAAHKNREIWKSRTARRGRSRFSSSCNMACHVENERGLRKHRRTHYGESEVSAGVPSHRRAESWTQTSSNF